MKGRVRALERQLHSREYQVITFDEDELDDKTVMTKEEWQAAWAEHEAAHIEAMKQGRRLWRVPPPEHCPE